MFLAAPALRPNLKAAQSIGYPESAFESPANASDVDCMRIRRVNDHQRTSQCHGDETSIVPHQSRFQETFEQGINQKSLSRQIGSVGTEPNSIPSA
jgi:hypothetical protein